MRHLLTISLISFLFLNALGQKTKRRGHASSWSDTTFIIAKLSDTIVSNKIVKIEIGKKAIIFLSLTDLITEVKTYLSTDAKRDSYKEIISFFDSASLKSDTISLLNYYKPQYLQYLISHLLIVGRAKVFYKRRVAFVDTIFHRLEKYGGNADRFFYLPDKRPFFAVKEYSGILDTNDDMLGKDHFDAYVKEGEKLQSIREE